MMTVNKGKQREVRYERRNNVGEHGDHQRAGGTDTGEPNPERNGIEPPFVEAHDRRADEIIGAGADGSCRCASSGEKCKQSDGDRLSAAAAA